MVKKVVLVGHCGPDSSYLRMLVTGAIRGAQVLSADDDAELSRVIGERPDLLLVNRELPYGFSEPQGVAVIRRLRQFDSTLKMMLVSNYPDAQAAAVAEGALPGFGKREIGSPNVKQLLREAINVSG